MEKVKKELEEEVRQLVEKLEEKLKKFRANLLKRILKNKRKIFNNHLSISNEVYTLDLLAESKRQILQDSFLSKYTAN